MTGPKLSRIDMDAVAPLTPHDKTAAVVGGKGVHYEFSVLPTRAFSDTPLPMRPPSKAELGNPAFINLTGRKVGRMTIVGIAERKTNDGMNWVVRCVCGNYETRKTKYLKTCLGGTFSEGVELMCAWCLNTRRLQKGKGSRAEERKWREVLGEDFPS